jgi:K+-sensing histidine kinase KdpD
MGPADRTPADRSEVAVDAIRRHRDAAAGVAAILLPLAVSAILVPFRASFATPAAALVLVAVVVAIAGIGRRAAGFLASVSAALWFDFFLTRPYERFAITHRPDIETTISLFVVGMVVTELAARNRHHREAAIEESEYVGLIHRVSELTASGSPSDEVIERARAELVELLNLRDCRYESTPAARPVPRIERDGRVKVAGALWEVHRLGLPGPESELVVSGRGRTMGRFVLKPTPGLAVSLQRRVVAVAIADQVGAAMLPQLRLA